ncbi:MAG: porin [Planctomycetota bacterium]
MRLDLLGTLAALTAASTCLAQPDDLDRAAELELSRGGWAPAARGAGETPRTFRPAPIAGENGASLRVTGFIHYRWFNNFRQQQDSDNDFTTGTEFRRVRTVFQGRLNDRVAYKIEGEANNGVSRLFEAWASYRIDDNWRLKLGQFRNHFSRVRQTSATALQLVDRAILNYEVQPQMFIRTQGVELRYRDDEQLFAVMLNEGSRGVNTTFTDDEVDYAFTVRYDRRLAGPFDPTSPLSSPRGSAFAAMVGAGFHYQEGEDAVGERAAWTVDGSVLGDGWSVHAAYEGHSAEDLNAIGEPELINGFFVQGGVFVTDRLELAARYEHAWTSDDDDTLSLITLGFNYFIYGQALKLSSDVVIGLEPVSGTFARRADGILIDEPGEDGQIAWRTQIQLVF